MEVYSKDRERKIEVLTKLDKRLEEYRADIAEVLSGLGGKEEQTADAVSDLCVGLAYDADDLDDAFGVGYAEEKSKAIIAVAGVAALLGDLASKNTSVNVSAAQMRQMSGVLLDAARDLDALANRSTLLCG